MADQAQIPLEVVFVPAQNQSQIQKAIADLQKYNPKVFVNTNFGEAGKDVSQFTASLDRANQRVISFTSSVSVLYSTIKIFKDIVSSTIEVDKALTSINSTMKLSSGNLDRFSKDLFDAARATSSSFEDAAAAAQAFARQGLSVEETLRRTKDALTLSRIAGIDAAESVKELTEAVNIFQKSGVTTTDVVKALSSVSSNFAISTKDVSDAFTRFGAVAQQAGLSFNQTIALITAVRQTSQREGAAIGTALTSIFEKLQPKDAIESLNRLGVAVRNSAGGLLPTIGVVENLAKSYDHLGTAQKSQIDKMIGGARQIEILKAGIIQLADANGTYSQASKVLASGADDVTIRLNAQNQSISALLSNFSTAAKQIQSNIGQLTFAPLLKGALGDGGDGNPITKALEDASGHADTAGGKIAEGLLRGIGDGIIFGLAPILLAAAAKVTSSTFGVLFRDIGDQAGISKQTAEQQAMAEASKEQASLQQQIVQLYKTGGEELQVALANMTSLTERAALLQEILSKGGIASAALSATAAADAGAVYSLRHAAGGYLSVGSESAAIAAGVGGAPSNAHAVVIPNFRYGPGQTGPIVANSSEYLVNLGAGDAIYNQDMVKTLGLPSNAQKIGGAAGGYLPGDLRLNLGADAQRGGAGDFGLQAEGLSELNKLFDTLSKAPNLEAASKVGPAIVDFSSALDKLSSKRVLKDLADQFNTLAQAEGIGVAKVFKPGSDRAQAGLTDSLNRAKFGSQAIESAFYASPHGAALSSAQAAYDAIGSGGRSLPPGPPSSPYVGPNYGAYPNPIGPENRPGANQSFYTRANNRLQGSNLGLAAAIGLPFIGGAIDEFGGAGGTGRGETVGALSGAFKGAGTGVGAGLLVGQPLGGALIGGAIGGIKGFLDKMSQSFSELADEIAQKNNAIKANYDKAAAVFQIQDQLKEAYANNADPETIKRLQRNQASAVGEISDDKIKGLLVGSALNDPATRTKVLGGYDQQSENTNRAGGVAGAFNIAKNTSSLFNQIGFDPASQFGVGYSPSVDPKAVNAIAQQTGGVLANLTPQQINALKFRLSQGDARGAADFVQTAAGVSPSQIASNQPNAITSNDVYSTTVLKGIQKALDANKGSDFEKANATAIQQSNDLEQTIRHLAESFQIAAKNAETFTQGFLKITESIQKTILAITLQTEGDKIAQQGDFDKANIKTTFAGQRTQVGLTASAGLLEALGKGGVQDPGLLAQAGSARSVGDFQALQARFSSFTPGLVKGPADATDAKEYQKLLQSTVDKLTEISTNEVTSLKVAETTNQLLAIQNKSREKDTLITNARYDPAAFGQFQAQSGVGNTGSNRGARLQSLLNAQGSLNSLGLPQTDETLQYTSDLQVGRTRDTLATLAAGRLGAGVGSNDQSLSAAAAKLQADGRPTGDYELGQRIAQAVKLQQFSPGEAISDIQSKIGSNPKQFSETLKLSGLSGSDQLASSGFNAVTNAISGSGGTNDLLTELLNLFTPGSDGKTSKQVDSFISSVGGPLNGDFFGGTSPVTGPTSSAFSLFSKGRSGGKRRKIAGRPSDDGNDETSDSPFAGLGGFGTGFAQVADSAKTGISNLQGVGAQVADGIVSSFNRAWDSFATGSERAGKAFKSFITGITADASRAFADQAFKQLFSNFGSTNADGSGGWTASIGNALGSLFGGGHAMGGIIGLAKGGRVPAMLTGGEFYVTPQASKAIGYDKLGMINRGYAGGGLVMGGSGMKDDVPASLPQGSFILRKSAVQRYGAGNLQALVNRRANGGRIGFDDGGFADDTGESGGSESSFADDFSSTGALGSGAGGVGSAGSAASSGFNFSGIYGMALSLALNLIMQYLNKSPGLLDTAQTTSNAERIRNFQQNAFSNPQSVPGNVAGAGGVKGGSAFLQADGNGGYRVINYGGAAVSATNYSNNANGGPILSMPGYADGGAVMPASSSSGGGSPNVGVQVTVHNYAGQGGGISSNTQTNGSKGDLQSAAFAKQLGEQMEATAKKVLVDSLRDGGIFAQKNRFSPSTQN